MQVQSCFMGILATVPSTVLRAVSIDALRDCVSMDAEGVGRIGDAPVITNKGFLNVELFELLESFIEHDVSIKHLFDHSFQSGAYLHRTSLTKSKSKGLAY